MQRVAAIVNPASGGIRLVSVTAAAAMLLASSGLSAQTASVSYDRLRDTTVVDASAQIVIPPSSDSSGADSLRLIVGVQFKGRERVGSAYRAYVTAVLTRKTTSRTHRLDSTRVLSLVLDGKDRITGRPVVFAAHDFDVIDTVIEIVQYQFTPADLERLARAVGVEARIGAGPEIPEANRLASMAAAVLWAASTAKLNQ